MLMFYVCAYRKIPSTQRATEPLGGKQAYIRSTSVPGDDLLRHACRCNGMRTPSKPSQLEVEWKRKDHRCPWSSHRITHSHIVHKHGGVISKAGELSPKNSLRKNSKKWLCRSTGSPHPGASPCRFLKVELWAAPGRNRAAPSHRSDRSGYPAVHSRATCPASTL